MTSRTRLFASLAAPSLLVVLAAACEAPTPTSPTLGALPGPAGGPTSVPPQANGASVQRGDLRFPANIVVPVPCLGGGTLVITGEITGWEEVVVNPNGRVHVNEYLDFAALTATLGERVWTAAPGAHEIFSFTPRAAAGSGASGFVHEGHSRFISQGGDPDILFVHRIHVTFLPGGDLQRAYGVMEVQCIGTAGV